MTTNVAIQKWAVVLAIAGLVLAAGCARLPGTTPIKAKNLTELQGYLVAHKPDVEQFRLRGPFTVTEHPDYHIQLSPNEGINADLYLSGQPEKAPLVIIMHGFDSGKGAHAYQAMYLASWGMHCLVVQLPNQGPWVSNGRALARITNFVYRWPDIIDSRVDVNKIVLVGHSFGAASVSVALADGAPALGGVLLDPASLDRRIPGFLRKIDKPVMVIGADQHVSAANNRNNFYALVRSGISEVSIKDAYHEDAQFPSEAGAPTTEELQISFASALTAAAFSLSFTGKFDYAWTSFAGSIQNGTFFAAKKK